ncbi:hypothetical protein [Streptomyces sp. AM8-1-1]|uniref:hypothetical protein n=1 Tax=Streptomyces sp. AM8-1-1 TaxID=3075825 RepID=UPI0028C3C8C9|nr:hypothetical protein [Streptomyces sp. AM8-1-1]WNO76817.1 hypothetical protein RPQ07_36610 [Streptomyces sp. AM8-1-1]
MGDLTSTVIEAQGGLERYNQFSTVTVHFRSGGALWGLKGQEGVFDHAGVRLDIHGEHASHYPFKSPDLHTSLTAERVAVENAAGEVKAERLDPRAAFAGHSLETPWDDLHVAYFAGYAMWTYLTSPFTFAAPDFQTEELPSVTEDGQILRRLKVSFPDRIATHCQDQIFYFDQDGLLRRHDYTAEVINAGAAAHYCSEHKEFDGILVPTRRRVHPLAEDGTVSRDLELITIDVESALFI